MKNTFIFALETKRQLQGAKIKNPAPQIFIAYLLGAVARTHWVDNFGKLPRAFSCEVWSASAHYKHTYINARGSILTHTQPTFQRTLQGAKIKCAQKNCHCVFTWGGSQNTILRNHSPPKREALKGGLCVCAFQQAGFYLEQDIEDEKQFFVRSDIAFSRAVRGIEHRDNPHVNCCKKFIKLQHELSE